jgi:hypothetical protein
MKLKRHPFGYQTKDGRFIVQPDSTENECGCIHCEDGRSFDCPNGGVRTDEGWVVWDEETGDYLKGTGPLQFERKRDAVEYLAWAIEKGET